MTNRVLAKGSVNTLLQAYRACSGDLDFDMVLNRMDSAFLQSASDGQHMPVGLKHSMLV